MVFNRFVRLEIATNGNCFFVANLGYREIRKSQWYRDKIDAGLDYSRGKIRWLRGKEVVKK